MKLYEQGALSSGRAAALLSITRWDFLDLLGRYGVSYFDDDIDFDEELRRGRLDPVVSNTTPLITFAGVGLLDVLPALYQAILIPNAVYTEY